MKEKRVFLTKHSPAYWRLTLNHPPLNIFGSKTIPQVNEIITAIETDGKFDPHVHEALLSQPSEDAESGSVVGVVQKGYKLGDRVVRPARVIVAE